MVGVRRNPAKRSESNPFRTLEAGAQSDRDHAPMDTIAPVRTEGINWYTGAPPACWLGDEAMIRPDGVGV